MPLSHDVCFTHFDVQFLEKFGVTFATEGETLTLKCSVLVTPELKRLRPRAEWYRDGKSVHCIEAAWKMLEKTLISLEHEIRKFNFRIKQISFSSMNLWT